MQILYLYIPRLGGEPILDRQRNIVHGWRNQQRDAIFLEPKWTDPIEGYEDKLKRLISDIENIALDKYDRICFVGISAGGSLGFNLFCQFKSDNRFHFISIGGKIIGANGIGSDYSKPHPGLVPSVKHSDELVEKLSLRNKQRMLTIGPIFDEVVLTKYMKVPGVRHITLPLIEHVFSIYVVIRFLKFLIFRFVEEQA